MLTDNSAAPVISLAMPAQPEASVRLAESAQMGKAFSLLPPFPSLGARVVVLNPDAATLDGLCSRPLLLAAH